MFTGPLTEPIKVKSEIRLTQAQLNQALLEYLQRNGIAVLQITSILPEEGQRGDPQGVKLEVELGGTRPASGGTTYRHGDGDGDDHWRA